ncbi:hypothetical protein [Pseudomonas avellanae]|uniref:hypothetical protein n=1 Tax=Pseudomonas avellanae TaxID=46257 RepID=UPI001675B7D6|nr:hypothetical protein [Pseudomonas avellanae]UQW68439.1 hypothetical protein L2Y00_25095 [Pseudomonas avellanae]GGJ53688.1 hypothetical protein GCM10009085_53800 [Pseudomonas avellanae]
MIGGSLVTGTLLSFAAAALAVYQSVHIAIVDKALRSLIINTGETAGGLLAVRLGALGLGLGSIIAPLNLIGTFGATWSDWDKWKTAFISGTSGEKTGAMIGLTGDAGAIGVNSAITLYAGKEMVGLLKEVNSATDSTKKMVASVLFSKKISHQLTENSNLINSLACRLWVTYFENSTLAEHGLPEARVFFTSQCTSPLGG